jgi:hypothetical protein
LKHELGIGKLKLIDRGRGCMGIPKLVVLLVLVLLFFLIMACFIPNNRNIFISMTLLVLAKGLVLQIDNIYSFSQDAISTKY